MSEINVHITVKDANGKNSDVAVVGPILPGDIITERINVLAAEAAALAHTALVLPDRFMLRDKREARRAR